MTRDANVSLRWWVIVAAAVALLATGAGTAYLVLRSGDDSRAGGGSSGMTASPASASDSSASTAPTVPPDTAPRDVVVTLSPDAVGRAGITVTTVALGHATGSQRLAGIVEPNAYRQVVVTPLVAGRITDVLVELGDRVRQGQTMAQVFSPELAEVHARYTSALAELEAHEQELRRGGKLVEIGAGSRQELERIHAEHTARTAEVQTARSRLELLGVPAAPHSAVPGKEIGTRASVPAPIAGVVT